MAAGDIRTEATDDAATDLREGSVDREGIEIRQDDQTTRAAIMATGGAHAIDRFA
jgi:hypothetical protein